MNRKLLGVLRMLPMLWLPASCVVDDGSAGPSSDSPDTTSDVAALTDDHPPTCGTPSTPACPVVTAPLASQSVEDNASGPSSNFQETHPPTCGTNGTPPCPG
jgi:hypothetical protein